MVFDANNRSSFAPLEGVVGKRRREHSSGPFLSTKGRPSFHQTELQSTAASSSKPSQVLVNLKSITLPFPLLDQAVFTSIYNTPSINRLGILTAQLPQKAPTLDLSSRVAFPLPRASTLLVPKLVSQLSGSHSSLVCTIFISDLLDFLTFHVVSVRTIRFSYLHTKSSLGTFLTTHAFATLKEVDITFLPSAFTRCVSWILQVIAAQPSLETLEYTVLDAWDGFELGRGSWAGWADGAVIPPVVSLEAAWRGVMARRLMLRLRRTKGDEDFIATDVELILPHTPRVVPAQTRSISENEPCIFTLSFGAEKDRFSTGIPSISWSNWTEHVEIFTSHEYLQALFFTCSVTPTPTVTTTIACSSSCYDSLLQSHPDLHAATELVSGYEKLWMLAVDLNLERLRTLAGYPREYVLDVFWNVLGKKETNLVEYKGTGVEHEPEEEGGGTRRQSIEFVSLLEEKPVGERILDCDCFGSSGIRLEDPISAIKRCDEEEVRAALALGGEFDFEEFETSRV